MSHPVQALRSSLQSVYPALPPRAQDLACSAYGLVEQYRRVGLGAPRLMDEIDRATEGPMHQPLVAARLRHILRTASALPGYASHTAGVRSNDPFEMLLEWNPLEKEQLRSAPEHFLTRRPRAGDFLTTTSGTTGTPVPIWRTRSTIREIMLSLATFRRWHGIDNREWRASITGKLVVPQGAQRVWRINYPGRQVLLSQYHLQRNFSHSYLEMLSRFEPSVLDGYALALVNLAELLKDSLSCVHPSVRLIVTTAEQIERAGRRLLSEVFDARVTDQYASSEHLCLAAECEAGERHIFPNVGIIEVVDADGRPCAPGEVGSLLLTTLLNDLMPLVRYRVGDRGAIDDRPCPCGRLSPRLTVLAGRSDDVVIGPSGQRVGIFAFNLLRGVSVPVVAMQLRQHSVHDFTVLARLDSGSDTAEFERHVLRNFDALLGPDERRLVRFDYATPLERTPGGKVRNVVVEFENPVV